MTSIIRRHSLARSTGALLFAVLLGGACQAPNDASRNEPAAGSQSSLSEEVLAINVGGDDSISPDKTVFAADTVFVRGGVSGEIKEVFGTAYPALYESYREGDFEIDMPIADGRYDITFHFAEPTETEEAQRVFDVLVEGETVIPHLDIRFVRSGKTIKAVSRTVSNVKVADGRLNVTFDAHRGVPVLSGLHIVPHTVFDKSGYRLSWSDEFDTDGAPDPERWNLEIWDAGKVNQEAQAYTDARKNARVKDGMLIIEAHKEPHRNAEYTSARLTSRDKGDFLYGRVEVRARLPLGGGTWPAIWLYSSDRFRNSADCSAIERRDWTTDCQAWPNSGEIDIMEHVGNTPGVVHSSIHTRAYYWINGEHRKGAVQVDLSNEQFHEYAINWTPDRLDMFVDDARFFTYRREDNADWKTWPFDHPYHVILNLAIGGMWGAQNGGIDDTVFPQQFFIDYVRVYEAIDVNPESAIAN